MATAHDPVVARPGTMLGHRYELRALLGSGGMAQVWSATDLTLDRVVAIKLLHPHLHSDLPSVERFRREAVAVAALSHPNIVAVFDTVSEPGIEAIVMEYIDGPSLRSVLDDRHTLEPREVVELGTRLAGAMAHAHAHGVIHRDIKPANILLTRGGVPKLTDFGIAKGVAEQDLTMVGTIIGTPAYLAPEHVANQPVDRRADLYSLCVVLYEAISGSVPFIGDDATAVALARLHYDPQPLEVVAPQVDRDLAGVIMRGLMRSPDQRFQSAADLEAALRTPAHHRDASAQDHRSDTFAADPVPEIASTRAESVVGVIDVDSHSGETDLGDRRRPKERRNIVGKSVLTLLCLAPIATLVALIAVPLTAGDSPGPTTSTTPARQTLVAERASSFDPQGDGAEHEESASNAIDGDPSTSWTTERYNDRTFGRKDGVGLVIDLGESYEIDELQISGSTGWIGSVSVTETDPTIHEVPPDPTAALALASSPHGQPLGGAPGRFITVWITDLGPAQSRGHQVRIDELVVVGRGAP